MSNLKKTKIMGARKGDHSNKERMDLDFLKPTIDKLNPMLGKPIDIVIKDTVKIAQVVETGFVAQNRDYIIGLGNVIITLLIFYFSRLLLNRDKVTDSEYNFQFTLFQNNVLPCCNVTVSYRDDLDGIIINSMNLMRSAAAATPQRRKIVESLIRQVEGLYEKHIRSLSTIEVFSLGLKDSLIEVVEVHYDELSNALSDLLTADLSISRAYESKVTRIRVKNDELVSNFSQKVQAGRPKHRLGFFGENCK